MCRRALSAYAAAGHKIIMYHGWADPRLVPVLSIQFYGAVARNLDDENGETRIDDFFRLFMVPDRSRDRTRST